MTLEEFIQRKKVLSGEARKRAEKATTRAEYDVAMKQHEIEWKQMRAAEKELSKNALTEETQAVEFQKFLAAVKVKVPTLATPLEKLFVDPEKFITKNYLYIGLAILALFLFTKTR